MNPKAIAKAAFELWADEYYPRPKWKDWANVPDDERDQYGRLATRVVRAYLRVAGAAVRGEEDA